MELKGGVGMELQKDCGDPAICVSNAQVLLAKHGKPERLELEYWAGVINLVTAFWASGYKHTFNGFAWGYSGRGPKGLEAFLHMCGLNIGLPQIEKWSMKEPRTIQVS